MTAHQVVTLHCQWLPGERFGLWGETDLQTTLESQELKMMLFAWHQASFYGSLIETDERESRGYILLTADQALDFLCAPPSLFHIRWRYSDEMRILFRIAPLVHEAIQAGRYMPDYRSRYDEAISWKLQLPEEAANEVDHLPIARLWTAALIAGQRHAFDDRIDLEAARSAAHHQWLDEEDWLISIGWRTDPTPFRICLQLAEPPLPEEPWSLHILLQDRQAAERQIRWQPGQPVRTTSDAAASSTAPNDAEQPLPADWQPYLPQVWKRLRRWEQMLPWLVDETQVREDPPNDAADTAADMSNTTSSDSVRLRMQLTYDEAWRFLTEGSLILIESGDTVLWPPWWERIKTMKPRLRARIRSSIGPAQQSMFGLNQVMQFDWRIAIGEQEFTEQEFAELVARDRQLLHIRGQWIGLDRASLEQMRRMMKKMQTGKGLTFRDVLEIHLTGEHRRMINGDDKQSGEDIGVEVELNDSLRERVGQLTKSVEWPRPPVPETFIGTLRPYQLDGMAWLLHLRWLGLGGCLADDMGLGKTIQWITYLLSVKEKEQPEAPSLLICPTSVLGNWQKELQRFAPQIKVHLQYGPQRVKGAEFAQAIQGIDLVLTSYTLAHLDQSELNTIQWESICLDEAQNIKNAYTKQATAIRSLHGRHRIAMTGTPVENRLTELWSIFEFINPGYLGHLREFTQHYVIPIEREKDSERTQQLQRLVQPFLLRREKKDPAIQLNLPEKHESKMFVSLTAEQGSLYENYIQDMLSRLDRLSTMERRGVILGALTKLKQLCNHPALLLKEHASKYTIERSNKAKRLVEMVEELRAEGDACLIFTQFVDTGLMLQTMLRQQSGEDVLFLHGGTSKVDRDTMIARFQDGDYHLFILSLKAGGSGLNLTAANHVFHFDRWWNPAVENQATDRAFRIGQTRHVQVHKFVTLGTLEEKIDELIERKLEMSEQIVGSSEGWITELSTEELREVLALRSEWIAK